MVAGRPELGRESVVEHGTSTTSRWLRERRVRFAALIALVEGALVLIDAIPRWPALIVAGLVVAFYLAYARNLRSDLARQTTWIAAASQAMVALVPILLIVVGTLLVVAVGIIAVVALFVLFSDRR